MIDRLSHMVNIKATVCFFLLLIFSGCLFSKKVTLPELIKPDSLQVKDQYVFIVENEKIHIYSLPGLKLLKTFGRAGQGPREFQLYRSSMKFSEKIWVSFINNQIWVSSLRKISVFSKKGDYIREKRLADPFAFAQTPLGEGFIGVSLDRKGFGSWVYSFNLYNSTGRKIKTVCCHKKYIHTGSLNKRGLGLVWIDRLTKGPEYLLHGGKIYISGSPGFTIDVYNQKGEMINKISHIYNRQKIPGSDKPKILNAHRGSRTNEDLWRQIRKIINVPEFYPEFRTFQISDHKIYVQTYAKKSGKTEFLIFDLQGNKTGQVYLTLKYKNYIEPHPYVISDGILYQLNENPEKEEWELCLTEFPRK